jgi:hypothetical protein
MSAIPQLVHDGFRRALEEPIECRVVARKRSARTSAFAPLVGEERKYFKRVKNDANDPERTSRPERNLRLGDEFILGQIRPV